ILVDYRLIKVSQPSRNLLRQLRIAVIKQPGQQEPQQPRENRNAGKDQFSRMTSLRLGSVGFVLRSRNPVPFGAEGNSVKNRPEKFLKMIAAAQRCRNPNPTANERQHRQHHQRHHHQPRTLVDPAVPMSMPLWRGRPRPRVGMSKIVRRLVMRILRGPPVLPKERHEPKPEHIKRRKKSSEQSNKPVNPAGLIGSPQNFVLTEESGKRRNSGDGKGGDGHGPERPRNL